MRMALIPSDNRESLCCRVFGSSLLEEFGPSSMRCGITLKSEVGLPAALRKPI
jgi:hypothetical protein